MDVDVLWEIHGSPEATQIRKLLCLRMREIPVHWNHHEGSKVRFIHDSVQMLREVAALRLQR